jgi:hypothetical protein
MAMALTSAQYAQIAAAYERAAVDEGFPTQSRAAFVKKAGWFRMLAQIGAAKEIGARSPASCENEKFLARFPLAGPGSKAPEQITREQ